MTDHRKKTAPLTRQRGDVITVCWADDDQGAFASKFPLVFLDV